MQAMIFLKTRIDKFNKKLLHSRICHVTFGIVALLFIIPSTITTASAADASPTVLELKKMDTSTGKGKLATAGSNVTVHYTGWLYSPKAPKQHGARFDSSLNGTPFTFKLGAGKVIPGWDEGLVGMRVGGKRTLIVPATLGYGNRGAGPIPPNANLIFDIELLEVN